MSALVRPVHATRSNPRIEAPIPALPPASSTAVASNGFLDFWNGDMSTVVYQHDTGNREGYYGEMTVVSKNELIDLLAFVSVYGPDEFPDDEEDTYDLATAP